MPNSAAIRKLIAALLFFAKAIGICGLALAVFAVLCWSPSAHSVPLRDAQVAAAKRIILMPGTFDPITNGHIAIANAAINETGGDLVILLPMSQTLHKQALPFKHRLGFVHLALAETPEIAYPYESEWEESAKEWNSVSRFLERIRSLNPSAQTSLLIGEDVAKKWISPVLPRNSFDEVLVANRDSRSDGAASPLLHGHKLRFLKSIAPGVSSTVVRRLLQENFELYLADGREVRSTDEYQRLASLLPAKTLEGILASGAYLDRTQGGKISPWSRVVNWLKRKMTAALVATDLYDAFKSAIVSLKVRPDRSEVEINGKSYKVARYLGSGLSADAYVIEFDGKTVAIKIARDESGRQSILRSVPIHLWAQKRAGILCPELIDYDSEGNWVMTELIKGESAQSYLEKHGAFSSGQRRSIEDIHVKALAIAASGNIGLDISPDNFIVKGEQVYLVDLGPVPIDRRLTEASNALISRWERKFGGPKGEICRSLFEARQ